MRKISHSLPLSHTCRVHISRTLSPRTLSGYDRPRRSYASQGWAIRLNIDQQYSIYLLHSKSLHVYSNGYQEDFDSILSAFWASHAQNICPSWSVLCMVSLACHILHKCDMVVSPMSVTLAVRDVNGALGDWLWPISSWEVTNPLSGEKSAHWPLFKIAI